MFHLNVSSFSAVAFEDPDIAVLLNHPRPLCSHQEKVPGPVSGRLVGQQCPTQSELHSLGCAAIHMLGGAGPFPYNVDHLPYNYHMFFLLKKLLKGWKFGSN